MKKYIVKVNGKSYEVEVEEIQNQRENTYIPKSRVENEIHTKEIKEIRHEVEPKPEEPKVQNAETVSSDEEILRAPMSGTIVKIKVNVGETVKDGQTILTLEAMKMENEILAPFNCKIKSILVKEGQQVEIDQPLVTLYQI
ncbi:MAG: acetyl-CoA carboxylase biotin carboxyl carrier protein subunit [Mesoaciditoga sp.]|uniref:biotin/lipoyl-containing protein n=1 Tax=Athalassotoga sp. TaxID=2022597 RepID=UPI000CB0A05E|nr:MAG: acetyl-CoA carboxylase biotin carboxyl carrier protein subunit [Mesoaciditoga sp.]PMP79630.1 MAG: acetyl-CoA carboxylase biotin carboxyl carrier protein subunit [Mesoaciditoga sp.]HEU24539.1 biotin/lipoyl-binding protein [Mesoaciditoga lauensis]